MEVDNAPPCPPPLPNDPAALEGELRAAVTGQQQQQDYGRALAAAEAAELLIQTGQWPPTAGDAAVVLAAQLLLLLIARDLENARFLWRRSDAAHKAAGSPLAEAWEVGKLLWTRDVAGACARMAGLQWAPAAADILQPLLLALRARVAADEVALCAKAYKRLTARQLAGKLGLASAEEGMAVARRAGWRVLDENKGELAPVPAPSGEGAAGETVGLPQLEQLAKYVAFLERRSATSLTA